MPSGNSITLQGVEFAGGFCVSLVTTLIVVPWLIPRLKNRGIVGRDLNKPGNPAVAEMGGIAVVVGFFAGVSVLLALVAEEDVDLLNVSLSAIIGASFVGVMDDVFDLRQRHKAFLPFVLALPFATQADSHVVIPHVVDLNFGPWMLVVAAFAVTCAANAANMLEGFNGLGTGLGIIMSFTLLILCIQHNRMYGAYILTPLVGALIAFLWFNKYPARIFPGDTLMLFMGASLAVSGILSNLQVQTTFIFLPMIAEFGLKVRGRFRAENYASRSSNGYLEYHGRIESLTHILMKKYRLKEPQLVYVVWAIEAVICTFVIAVDSVL